MALTSTTTGLFRVPSKPQSFVRSLQPTKCGSASSSPFWALLVLLSLAPWLTKPALRAALALALAAAAEVEEVVAALGVVLAVDLEQVSVGDSEPVVVKVGALAEVRALAVVSVVVQEVVRVVGASRYMYLLDKPACYMTRR